MIIALSIVWYVTVLIRKAFPFLVRSYFLGDLSNRVLPPENVIEKHHQFYSCFVPIETLDTKIHHNRDLYYPSLQHLQFLN